MCVNVEPTGASATTALQSDPSGGAPRTESLGLDADLEDAAAALISGNCDEGASDDDETGGRGGGGGDGSGSAVRTSPPLVSKAGESAPDVPAANAVLRDLALARAARAAPPPPSAKSKKSKKSKGGSGGGGGGSAANDGLEYGLPVVAVHTEAAIVADDDDALLDALLAARTRCAAVGCKTSVQTLSALCKFCALKFCYAHGQVNCARPCWLL